MDPTPPAWVSAMRQLARGTRRLRGEECLRGTAQVFTALLRRHCRQTLACGDPPTARGCQRVKGLFLRGHESERSVPRCAPAGSLATHSPIEAGFTQGQMKIDVPHSSRRTSSRSRVRQFPRLGLGLQRIGKFRPIMQCGGVEVGPVGPDERVTLGVESNLREKPPIAKRRKKFARQHRKKIDDLRRAVVEPHPQREIAAGLEAGDFNWPITSLLQISDATQPYPCS